MTNIIRILGISAVLVLVLSITVGNKTIFDHIYAAISPATIPVQDATESLFARSYKATSDYTKKLFANSVPKVKDSVKSGLSAPLKSAVPLEDITIHEKAELDQLIKTKR